MVIIIIVFLFLLCWINLLLVCSGGVLISYISLLYICQVGFDVSVAHVDFNQRVCAVRVEALEDLLPSYGFEIDVEFCQTGEGPERLLARFVYFQPIKYDGC